MLLQMLLLPLLLLGPQHPPPSPPPQVCGCLTQLPMVTPCLHLLCTDCTATSRTACPRCGQAYTMQPTHEPARFKTNPQPKWEVREGR